MLHNTMVCTLQVYGGKSSNLPAAARAFRTDRREHIDGRSTRVAAVVVKSLFERRHLANNIVTQAPPGVKTPCIYAVRIEVLRTVAVQIRVEANRTGSGWLVFKSEFNP